MYAVMAGRQDLGVMYPSGMAEGPAKFSQGQRGAVDRPLESARPVVQTLLCPFWAREPSKPQFPHL